MIDDTVPTVTVLPNGPYLVTGGLPLSIEILGVNEKDEVWEFEPVRSFEDQPKYALCRCGESATKPYCDGTHAKIAFDGTETASRASHKEQSKRSDGPQLELDDASAMCAYARFCDAGDGIWKTIRRAGGNSPKVELVRHEGTHCPSGRLVIFEPPSEAPIETAYEKSVVLLEDPQKKCSGPIALRGGIVVKSGDGTEYETRNRVTLCRCGKSQNKPLCDGTHADVAFSDGLS
jgi:CDGSH-type Zn-finger protein